MRLIALLLIALLFGGCYEDEASRPRQAKTEALEHYRAARAALETGDNVQAMSHAKTAYGADPAYENAALLYASLLGRAGQLDDALSVCAKLRAQYPDLVQAHILEGILWEKNGDREAANKAYDTVLALSDQAQNKEFEAVYFPVAAYLRHGKIEGVQATNAALERFPAYEPTLYLKQCMQDKERDFLLRWFSEGAERPFKRAEESPVNPEKN